MPAKAGALVKGVHQLQDMIGHQRIGAVRAVAPDRLDHLGNADTAAILHPSVMDRTRLPVFVSAPLYKHRTTEGVWVWAAQGACAAVYR
jgi:hypothetical protein